MKNLIFIIFVLAGGTVFGQLKEKEIPLIGYSSNIEAHIVIKGKYIILKEYVGYSHEITYSGFIIKKSLIELLNEKLNDYTLISSTFVQSNKVDYLERSGNHIQYILLRNK